MGCDHPIIHHPSRPTERADGLVELSWPWLVRVLYCAGFNTFDLADIYGPAEEITGAYHKQYGPKDGLFYTKV